VPYSDVRAFDHDDVGWAQTLFAFDAWSLVLLFLVQAGQATDARGASANPHSRASVRT
jgi:hypothetical protein